MKKNQAISLNFRSPACELEVALPCSIIKYLVRYDFTNVPEYLAGYIVTREYLIRFILFFFGVYF